MSLSETRKRRAAGPPSRTAETAYALAIGFLLNLVVTLTAQATALSAFEEVSHWASVAGALGGLVAALVHFAAIALTDGSEPEGGPAHARKVRRAVYEGAFSVIVGAIVAGYLAEHVGRWVRLSDPSDLSTVSFGVGVLAWRSAPGVLGAVKLIANPKTLRDFLLRQLGAAK